MNNGLAFSGGGLKIFAHIGVLKALEELNVKFEYISGTSSGSAIATLYALDIKPDEMIALISNKYSDIVEIRAGSVLVSAFKSLIKNELTLNSIIDGSKIENVIASIMKDADVKINNINEIEKNLAIVSCDTVTTKEIVFLSKDYGLKNTSRTDYIQDIDISTAVRASMSFPGIFKPCDYGKYNLIDGGTVNNIPSKVLKDMGADKVLGVSFKLNPYEPKDDIMKVALRAADIFSILNMEVAKKHVDLSIELEIPDTGLLDIKNIDEVCKLGYEQTMKQKEKILQIFS